MARSMTKQREALKLMLTTHLTSREIQAATGLSKSAVCRYRRAAQFKQLTWATVERWPADRIDAVLNKRPGGGKVLPAIDYAKLCDELTAKRMPLMVWYVDYQRQAYPRHRSYSSIAKGLRAFRKTMPTFMHMQHNPGERMSVDFSGHVPHYLDPKTGKKVKVVIFVGSCDASSYFFVKAIHAQSIPEFLRAHADMLAFFGGAPAVFVPDNAKCAVVRPGTDLELQRCYEDLAKHYGVTILPARPHHPKDKAVVEASVKIFKNQMLTRLRSFTFYSIEEINERIAVLLEAANNQPMSNGMPSRRQRFEAIDQPALRPLPPDRYVHADIVPKIRVDGGYHVLVRKHRYSVPHRLTGQHVSARLTHEVVELFHDGKKVAHHARSHAMGGLTTDPTHMPDAHRAQADRNPEGLKAWAKTAGPHIARFVQAQFDQERSFLGLRPADRVKTLVGKYGAALVDRALSDCPDLKTANVTDLQRKLAVMAKEGATTPARRSSNARGSRTFTSPEFPHARPVS